MGIREDYFYRSFILYILAANAHSTERDSLINVVNIIPADMFKMLNFEWLSRLYLYENPELSHGK